MESMDLRELNKNPEYYVPYPAGDVIFKEGDQGDTMYVIIEGQLEFLIRGTSVREFGPGEVFGEMALISEKPRSATVVAKTDCKVAPINRKRFLLLVQQSPQFSLHMLDIMAERIRWMDALIQGEKSSE